MSSSTGKTGQLAFELWAKRRGFVVDKVEPESHYVKGLGWVRGKTSGIFDYLGCMEQCCACGDVYLAYCAVEVKECTGDTYPCSLLSKEQTVWAKQKPANTCYVAIYNTERGNVEVFPWQEKGSYKRGQGIK